MVRKVLIFTISLFCLASCAKEEGTVYNARGKVIDQETGLGIDSALVVLYSALERIPSDQPSQKTYTNAAGEFRFQQSSEDLQSKSNIKDINANEFMADVIEASSEKPIIVDFWAPWCEPCKQLTPLLENAVINYKEKVTLAKINIDETQEIAAQLRIQSIPTVYTFLYNATHASKVIWNNFQQRIRFILQTTCIKIM